jgi:hypothetical protein
VSSIDDVSFGKTHLRLEVTHVNPNMWQSCLQVSPISLIEIGTDHAKNSSKLGLTMLRTFLQSLGTMSRPWRKENVNCVQPQYLMYVLQLNGVGVLRSPQYVSSNFWMPYQYQASMMSTLLDTGKMYMRLEVAMSNPRYGSRAHKLVPPRSSKLELTILKTFLQYLA